jgi:hypothetical protein
MAEDEIAHLCQHCENITFTLGGSISLPFMAVERADEAGCRFFQVILEKYPIEDTDLPFRRPMLVLSCDGAGHVDFCWMDGATKLLDSSDLWIDASSMFARKDSPAFADLNVGPLNSSPGSRKSFRVIRRWIRQCDEKHADCKILRKALSGQSPVRLIDVGVEGSEGVCIRNDVPAGAVQYAALSYCWGGEQESKTVRARLEERCKGFPLTYLSKTIQEAVITTRRLGLRYLWVDAICIVQDDEADCNRELPKMDQIYSGASITILAARVKKADDGFLQHRDLIEGYGSVCRVQYCRSPESARDVRSVFLSANRLDVTHDDPIDSRGWTFQERLRSFRVLRFGNKQTVWECPGRRCVDGGENYFDTPSSECLFTGTVTDSTFPHRLDDPSSEAKYELNLALGAWQHLVMEYSKRDLGQRADRLPAFAAIAKAFGSFLQLDSDQYVAGLWTFDICMQLRWRRPDDMAGDGGCNKRHGPTWSWASLDGPVIFDHPRLRTGVDTLRVDECQPRWKSPEFKYGEVEFAQLMVCGFLRLSVWKKGVFSGRRHGTEDLFPLPLKAYWDSDEERPPHVWCLEINTRSSTEGNTSFGVLLTKSVGNVYKRLGYFEFYHSEYKSEPCNAALDMRGLPPNSNWFYNGGYEKICIE